MTFAEILAQAIADLQQHGFDSVERVERWVEALRTAAKRETTIRDPEAMVSDALASIYRRLVENGGISRFNPGVQRFTIERVKPRLRAELDRRIVASANLIRNNRAEAIDTTLRRFEGWATSVPAGGSEAVDRRETKKDVGKALKQLPYRERVVAIDQGHKMVASVSEILARDSGAIAGVWSSRWRQAGYNYRKDHKERDGKVYLLKDSWAREKGLVKPGPAGFYEDITSAGEEVFCFPGDSKVPFADGVEKAYRRFYTGPVVDIVLASGTRMCATPNHPILTCKGWVAAGCLDETCHVVEAAEEVLRLAKEHKDDARVPVIQDIFRAVQEAGVTQALRLRPADFHGDGIEGEVDVVFATRPLRFGTIAVANVKPVADFALTKTQHSSAGFGYLMRRLCASFTATPSVMRSLYQRSALLGACLSHAGVHTFAAVSHGAARFFHVALHNGARHAEAGGDGFDAFASLVGRADFDSVEPYTARRRETGAESKIRRVDSVPKRPLIDFEDGSDLRNRLPFATKLSNVVEVNWRHDFAGHVYNLQTASGWYVTQNVITHNCRCTVKWLTNLRSLPDDMLTDKGRAALADARGRAQAVLLQAPAASQPTPEQRVAANARTKDPAERVVLVDVRKVDREWEKTPDYRVESHAPGKSYKLDRAKAFIRDLKSDAPFDAPKLGVSDRSFGFDDGRHRFAAMRDLGFAAAPVAMDPASVEHARRRGWLVER